MLSPIPLTGQNYDLASQLSAQRLVNVYAEPAPQAATRAKTGFYLRSTPGAAAWTTAGNGPIRGGIAHKGRDIVVSGDSVYRVATSGTATLMGTVPLGTDMVRLVSNGEQVMITVGSAGYIVEGNTLSAISDTDFPGSAMSAFFGGFFVSVDPVAQKFRWSTLYDGAAWDALDFASAELSPDKCKAVAINQQVMWLLGEESGEAWTFTGGSDLPFTRQYGAYLHRGIAAPASLAECDATLFFLADDGRVYAIQGGQLQRVSTLAMEQAIQGYSTVSNAHATSYVWNGSHRYILTFPTAGASWEFDPRTAQWNERATGVGVDMTRWRYNVAWKSATGNIVVGDSLSGRLDVLGGTAEASASKEKLWTLPEINNNGQRFTLDEVYIDMEVGVGLSGSYPQVMMDISTDGGLTWGGERYMSMGSLGQYKWRARATRLGMARNMLLRFRVTDDVDITVFSAYARVRGSAS